MVGMRALLTLLFSACVLWAQDAPTQFEVASIRPNTANDTRTTMNWGGPTFTATGFTLKRLVMQAFNLQDFQVTGGPPWFDKERWDLTGKAPDGINTKPEVLRGMLQTLLADRFHLTTHLASKQMTVLALYVNKGGSKLKQSAPDSPNSIMTARGHLAGKNQSVADMARMIAGQLGEQVVDKTRLTGRFDYDLTWEPDPAKGDGPSIYTAAQEQLGLKFEPEKAPVEILVVDRADRPTDN
jgi:uncharacterized protein (TIGR03435 family)